MAFGSDALRAQLRGRRGMVHLALFALGCLLLWWVCAQMSFGAFRGVLRRLSATEGLLVMLCYALMTLFRGIRIQALFPSGSRSLGHSVSFAAIHAWANHMLPFRLGELVLPMLLRAYLGEGILRGTLVLVTARLYDAMALLFLFGIALLATLGADGNIYWYLLACGLGFLLVAGFTLALPRALGVAHRSLLHRGSRLEKLAAKVGTLQGTVAGMRPSDRYLRLPVTSLGIWLSNYTMFYVVMHAFDYPVGFMRNLVASTGAVLATILPINGLGSFGVLEAGWMLGYRWLGLSAEESGATGLAMHVLVVLYGAIFAALAWAWLAERNDGGARLERP